MITKQVLSWLILYTACTLVTWLNVASVNKWYSMIGVGQAYIMYTSSQLLMHVIIECIIGYKTEYTSI